MLVPLPFWETLFRDEPSFERDQLLIDGPNSFDSLNQFAFRMPVQQMLSHISPLDEKNIHTHDPIVSHASRVPRSCHLQGTPASGNHI